MRRAGQIAAKVFGPGFKREAISMSRVSRSRDGQSAEYQTPDQVREERIRDMGRELGETYHALWCEAVWLHAKWALYRQLFADSPDRYDFLQKVAGHFFKVVEDVM
jgi:hypothetical protein